MVLLALAHTPLQSEEWGILSNDPTVSGRGVVLLYFYYSLVFPHYEYGMMYIVKYFIVTGVGFNAHEFILDVSPFKSTAGVDEMDVAKRLQDYGEVFISV